MVVVPCTECDSDFQDIARLNLHIRVTHQSCTKYVCRVDNCQRKYNLWGSFSKHLVVFHHVPRHSTSATSVIIESNAASDLTSDSIPSTSTCSEQTVEADQPNFKEVDFKVMLLKQQNLFVAKLYANSAFSRNLVDKMIKDFSEYLSSPFFDHFQTIVLSSVSPESPEKKLGIQDMFDMVMTPFAHLNTEYKRFAFFENSGDFIKPIAYDIAVREERVKRKTGMVLEMRPVQGQFIPFGQVLKLFFELPYALSDTLAFMQSLEKDGDWISNFTQCEVWQRKISKYDPNDIVIPVNFYYDDCEPNNSLGPHLDPLGCSYIHIPCLPPEWSSKLENIFLALLFDAHNRSVYGNNAVFKPVITELKKLETEGIMIRTTEFGDVKVYFVLGVILGDNKGLNEICGFNASFSANFYCRVCSCSKTLAYSMVKEDPALIRTPESYAHDAEQCDSETTGVKEKCVFSKIPSFLAPTDICVDEFHDVIEGVAHYTMLPVLNHFCSLISRFLPTLNSRMYCIDLGIDNDNRPPLINADRLCKDKLKMTGAEMYTFIRIFGVLVKDMIPEDDSFYKLYLLLNDIVSLVHAKGLPKNASALFQVTVKEHHDLYMSLTKQTLKPKHHFLIHYARLFTLFGPFGPLSTIRFEAKHRLLKMTSNVCNSRRNLSKTVALKQQLALCFRSVSKSSPRYSMVVGPVNLVDLRDLEHFPAFSLTLPDSVFNDPHQNLAKWVEYRGTKYEQRQVLVTGADEDGLFTFAEIKLIVVIDDRPLFVCCPFDTVGYYSAVRAYELQRIPTVALNWFAVEHLKLLDPFPLCLLTMSTGEHVVVAKYFMYIRLT